MCRDIPLLPARERGCNCKLLQLAQQLHYRADYAASGPGHRVRGVCLFRGILHSLWCVGFLFRARNEGADA